MESGSNSIFAMSGPMRLALFMAITGICMIAGAFISFSIVGLIMHAGLAEMQTILLSPEHAMMAQLANALASIIAFGAPSIAIAFFANGYWVRNMGFNPIGKMEQVGLVILLALAGLFLSGALGDLTEKIPLPTQLASWAKSMEDQYKKALLAMTQMKSLVDLFFALVTVAFIPSIVEELFFRASLQKILMDWFGKPYWAIVVTAIVFSAIHFSYYGFLSRMSLGIVLGCIYYFTKTIWMPMLMHFINNAIGVTTLYFVRADPQKVEAVVNGNLTYYWVFIAIIVVYLLLKKLKEYGA
jgi:membrane protease YdiL (CAAX protease family)